MSSATSVIYPSCDRPERSDDFPATVERLQAKRCVDGAESFAQNLAEECPVEFSYNGVPYAVMMASPADLEDFAIGFSRSEGIVRNVDDVRMISARASKDGVELEITLKPAPLRRFLSQRRVRTLRGHSSCGLCGVETLADIHTEPPGNRAVGVTPTTDAVNRATCMLRSFQPLGRETGATHAAAWASMDGQIVLAREDVGRHSALDKLVGALMRGNFDLATGFTIVTSRCSFEMVQKAVAAGMKTLVAVSAPTALAVRTARAAGLVVFASARGKNVSVF